MLIFPEVNGVQPDYTQQELIYLGLGIAAGNLDVSAILNWLSEHLDTCQNLNSQGSDKGWRFVLLFKKTIPPKNLK